MGYNDYFQVSSFQSDRIGIAWKVNVLYVLIYYYLCCSKFFQKAFDQIQEANMWTNKRWKKLEKAYLDLPHTDLCLTQEVWRSVTSNSNVNATQV